MHQLIFATHNRHKVNEIRDLIPHNFKVISLNELGHFDSILETENSIKRNALLKASYIANLYQVNCFADDTGLEVEALSGAPGVHSARYAGAHCSTEENIDKLLYNLKKERNRKARFKTVITLILNKNTYYFTGICKGEILFERRGDKGFGYDPIFKPEGFDLSFAEMDLKLKNRIGHRGQAFSQLISFLRDRVEG